ncbi:MAG TPA: hypothetical protein VJH90_03320 [archaeon]|nr:hypothetical protein [archaeon]
MRTKCDNCGKSVKDVGRLTNVRFRGLSQKLCKACKRKLKISFK